jgi:hypothetical protein
VVLLWRQTVTAAVLLERIRVLLLRKLPLVHWRERERREEREREREREREGRREGGDENLMWFTTENHTGGILITRRETED